MIPFPHSSFFSLDWKGVCGTLSVTSSVWQDRIQYTHTHRVMPGHGTSWGLFNFPAGNLCNLVPKILWQKKMVCTDDVLIDYLSLLSHFFLPSPSRSIISPSLNVIYPQLSSLPLCLPFSGWMAPACRDFGFRGPCDWRNPAVWQAATSGQPHHLSQQSNFCSLLSLKHSTILPHCQGVKYWEIVHERKCTRSVKILFD